MEKKQLVGFTIKTINGLMIRKMIAMIRRDDGEPLPMMHCMVIEYIYDHPDQEIYQKDLESALSIARSTVTSIVKQLERNGYIERVSVARDCRLKQIRLLPKGERRCAVEQKNIRYIDEILCAGIPAEDLDTFLRVAGKIRKNLEETTERM